MIVALEFRAAESRGMTRKSRAVRKHLCERLQGVGKGRVEFMEQGNGLSGATDLTAEVFEPAIEKVTRGGLPLAEG
jgi:hypothetical protein